MSRNNLIFAILGGAAAAAVITNYLSTERGKQVLNDASDYLKDLTAKFTEFSKQNLGRVKTDQGVQAS